MIIKSSTGASLNSQTERSFSQTDRITQQRLMQKKISQNAVESELKKSAPDTIAQDSGQVGLEKKLAISEENDHYRLQISREGMWLYRAAQQQQKAASEDADNFKDRAAMAGLKPEQAKRMGVSAL